MNTIENKQCPNCWGFQEYDENNLTSNTLTNYVNHIAETEVDFPSIETGKFTVTSN